MPPKASYWKVVSGFAVQKLLLAIQSDGNNHSGFPEGNQKSRWLRQHDGAACETIGEQQQQAGCSDRYLQLCQPSLCSPSQELFCLGLLT